MVAMIWEIIYDIYGQLMMTTMMVVVLSAVTGMM